VEPFSRDGGATKAARLGAAKRPRIIRREIAERLGATQNQIRDPLLTILTIFLAVILFVVVPLHASGLVPAQGYGFLLVLLLASCVLVQSRTLMVGIVLFMALGLTAAAAVFRFKVALKLDHFLVAGAGLIIGLLLIAVVARAVFARGPVNYHRVNGAILLYLTIGLTFVSLFTFVDLLAPQAFLGLPASDDQPLASGLIYFSFVTLTSTGYGDIVPVHPIARSLCNIEAIVGQLFPATLLARLVTLELEERRAR